MDSAEEDYAVLVFTEKHKEDSKRITKLAVIAPITVILQSSPESTV
jgi:hypothetical protein